MSGLTLDGGSTRDADLPGYATMVKPVHPVIRARLQLAGKKADHEKYGPEKGNYYRLSDFQSNMKPHCCSSVIVQIIMDNELQLQQRITSFLN
jgi:hypothetical protein